MTKTINRLLVDVDTSITNAQQDTLIQQRMAAAGMDTVKLREGETLRLRVQEILQRRNHEAAQFKRFSSQFQAQQKTMQKMYTHHLRRARLAFEDNVQAKATLRLSGRRPERYADWVQQVSNFYEVVTGTPEYQEEMIGVGTPQVQLHEGKTLVQTVPDLRAKRDLHSGEMQHLTEELKGAVKELRHWYRFFKATAGHVLVDMPQQMDKLGL